MLPLTNRIFLATSLQVCCFLRGILITLQDASKCSYSVSEYIAPIV